MRLRRETGDFQIVIENGTCTVRPGLKAEQFIGEIIKEPANGDQGVYFQVIIGVEETPTGANLFTEYNTYYYAYNKTTGAITVVPAEAPGQGN